MLLIPISMIALPPNIRHRSALYGNGLPADAGIAAFGNSDGDLQMLEWAKGGGGVRFALMVHQTDAER
jgi:hypothetical protein